MRSANRLLEAVGCDGEMQLHLPKNAKSPMRYLSGSQKLIFTSAMRDGIPNRNKTTRPNTDARLNAREFYDPGINQKIATRGMGGVEAFNDFMGAFIQAQWAN